jgi:hypothetical protein
MLKWKIIHAILKVNMDNYRCYLPSRVWIFKSSKHKLIGVLFIPQVHHLVSAMETQIAALLVIVTLMMMSPFLCIPVWSVGLTLVE